MTTIILSTISAVLSAVIIFSALWLAYVILRISALLAIQIMTFVIMFVLSSTLAFSFIGPIVRNISLDKNYWLSFGFFVSIMMIATALAQRDVNTKKYGSLAVIITLLLSILPFLIFYGTSAEQIADMRTATGIKISKPLTISGDWIFASYYMSISFSTFLFYGLDKQIAVVFPKDGKPDEKLDGIQKIGRKISVSMPFLKPPRVPENILHWHSFCGGTIAAFGAQKFFRHKSKKESFTNIYGITAIVQVFIVLFASFLSKFVFSN